jgi:hypothetical protein
VKSSLVKSLGWTYGSVAANGFLQILFLSVVSRYVSKADFGIVAICLILNSSIRILFQSSIERFVVWSSSFDLDDARGLLILSFSATFLIVSIISLFIHISHRKDHRSVLDFTSHWRSELAGTRAPAQINAISSPEHHRFCFIPHRVLLCGPIPCD